MWRRDGDRHHPPPPAPVAGRAARAAAERGRRPAHPLLDPRDDLAARDPRRMRPLAQVSGRQLLARRGGLSKRPRASTADGALRLLPSRTTAAPAVTGGSEPPLCPRVSAAGASLPPQCHGCPPPSVARPSSRRSPPPSPQAAQATSARVRTLRLRRATYKSDRGSFASRRPSVCSTATAGGRSEAPSSTSVRSRAARMTTGSRAALSSESVGHEREFRLPVTWDDA